MIVTRGLGRDGTAQRAILTTAGLGRQALELAGKFLRRWRTRWRKPDLENAPIRTRKEFARRVQAALDELRGSPALAERQRAKAIRRELAGRDEAPLWRVEFDVLLMQFEAVAWVLDAHELLIERRRRDDEAVAVLLLSGL